ncbi:hypothetical protein ACS0TY_015210 [Phlomoides rotata]
MGGSSLLTCYNIPAHVKHGNSMEFLVLMAYAYPIYGISHDQLWGDTLYIPPLPPNFGIRPTRGRKGKNRRLEQGEKEGKGKVDKRRMRRQQTSIRCRKCRHEGHNATTCKAQTEEGEQGQGSAPLREQNETTNTRGQTTTTRRSLRKRGQVRTSAQSDVESPQAGETPEEVVVAPPNLNTNQMGVEEREAAVIVGTQSSTITTSGWNEPVQDPMPPPTMHDQLQMGQPRGSRVQLRKPPRFGEGHFSRTPFVPPKNKGQQECIC